MKLVLPTWTTNFNDGKGNNRFHCFVWLPAGVGEHELFPEFKGDSLIVPINLINMIMNPMMLYGTGAFVKDFHTNPKSSLLIAHENAIDNLAQKGDEVNFEVEIPLPRSGLVLTPKHISKHKSVEILMVEPTTGNDAQKKMLTKVVMMVDLMEDAKTPGLSQRAASTLPVALF